MARLPRAVLPGVPLHVVQRGNNRAATFQCDEDRARYRETLREVARRHRCAVHAYAMMTNHVHLLLTPDDEQGPARVMQAIGRQYVRWVNFRHGRTGTLWEGRFRSSLVLSERYLLACYRYIELNPVRAGMVDHPAHYEWSSHRHNALGMPDTLVVPHPTYESLAERPSERLAAYAALFRRDLEPTVIDRIRTAVHRGVALGTDPPRDSPSAPRSVLNTTLTPG